MTLIIYCYDAINVKLLLYYFVYVNHDCIYILHDGLTFRVVGEGGGGGWGFDRNHTTSLIYYLKQQREDENDFILFI